MHAREGLLFCSYYITVTDTEVALFNHISEYVLERNHLHMIFPGNGLAAVAFMKCISMGDDEPIFWERRVKIVEFLTH